MKKSIVLRFFLALFPFILNSFLVAQNLVTVQDSMTTRLNPYCTITKMTMDGVSIDKVVIAGPPTPPTGFVRSTVALPKPNTTAAINTLSEVPAFSWSFGCSATSASMQAGYYDRHGYSNMYTGPTNGGVMPLDNSSWGTVVIHGGTWAQCPLSATRNGLDGRSIRGHVDDYWIDYDSTGPDPFVRNGWTEHTLGDCTGDFMKTNKWLSDSLGFNIDGGTTFYNYTNNSPLTAAQMESGGIQNRDGGYGIKLFYQSRGYTVTNMYNQNIYGNGGKSAGFTYSQYKAEIDAGRPVIINLAGHTVLGIGYNDATNLVYLHDTWDYSTHTMTWGGTYSGMQQLSVVIVQLAEAEIDIRGNGHSIPDGDTTRTTTDYTDFGTVNAGNTVTHDFTIYNTGSFPLQLTNVPIVQISGSSDFTVTAQPLTTSVASGGSTTFTVQYSPSVPGTQTATISIANTDLNENPYNFKIQGTESFITVSSPNGGENWGVGTSHDITWTSSGTSGNVHIEYSINSGSSWTDVVASTADDGAYTWTIPNAPSASCLVRVSDVDGTPSDQSNAVFTIVAVPGLLSPVDGSTGVSVTPTLSWNATSGATAYQLQVSKSAGFGTTVFDDTTITGTSRQVGPLGNDTTYYWRVRAKTAGGWSGYSAVWSFTTSPAGPAVPVLLAPANSSTGITITPTLSWNASSGATAYQLQVSKSSGFSTTVFDDSTITGTTKLVGPLGNDTTYYWRVRAKNSVGWSNYSSVWGFTTIVAIPQVPVLLTPANGSTGVPLLPTLSWNAAAGAAVYELQVSENSGFVTTVFDDTTIAITSGQVGPLGNDTTYYWRVRAKNAAGWGSYSTQWNFTIIVLPPPAPVLSAPLNGTTDFMVTPTLNWNASSGATSYELQVSKSAGFGALVFDDTTIAATSREIGPLGNDTTYYWRVRAKNAGGWSGFSAIWNFATVPAAPGAPILSTPLNGSTGISVTPTLGWNASTGASMYELQVSKNAGFSSLVFDDSTITTTTSQVGTLGNDTTYYWRVRAKDAGGWSGYSTAWNFTTIVLSPSAPVLLSPANGSNNQPVIPTLGWNASSGATAYQLQVSKSAAFDTTIFDDTTITAISRQVGPLGNDTTYYWRVRAKNAGGWSGYSAAWSFTTIVTAPQVPVLLAPASGSGNLSVTPLLSWNASAGAAVYRLQVSKSSGFGIVVFDDSTITGTSRQVGPLGNDTIYYWRVGAKNASGWTSFSSSWNFTTIVALPPVPVMVSPADGSVGVPVTPTLSWNSSPGASAYRLQVSKDPGFGTLVFDDSTIVTLSRQLGPLGNDTTFYWRIRAKNAAGWSSYASSWTFTTVIAAPQVPVLLSPGDGTGNITVTPTLSWNAASGAASYRLQVSKDAGFAQLVFDDSTITTTTRQVGPLGYDTTYYWRVRAKNSAAISAYSLPWSFTTITVTSIGRIGAGIPTEYRLDQNYPNPFNPSTTIMFGLPEEAVISLEIYDMSGRKVRTLLDGEREAGYYTTVWDAKDETGREVSSGIYVYRFKALGMKANNPFIKSGKLVLTK